MASHTIGIVIPILNQFQLAIEALASVKTEWPYRVYPMLNYKSDRSLAASWNEGASRAISDGCTHILIINDDILFSPVTIDCMKLTLDSHADVVLVSAQNQRGHIEAEEILSWWPLLINPTSEIEDNPDFACFMITSETLDVVGTFDEKFSPAYFEDNDYHRRIILSGHRGVCNKEAKYYHYGSKTQNHDPNWPVVPPFAFEINRAYYVSKWGGNVGEEIFKTPFNNPDLTWRDW